MYYYKEYTEKNEEPNKPDKVKRPYNNYPTCKHPIHRENCFTEKQTHKTITENCGRLEITMFFKIEKKEYKK